MVRGVTSGFAAALLAIGLGAAPAQADATAELHDTDGNSVGEVTLKRTPHGVLLHADLEDMPAGTHAFHVHETGTCEPPFKSAGGHFNPENKKHGLLDGKGPHAGDMPNIHVPDSGALEIEVLNTHLALDDELFDDDGAAIVIHEGADDYRTDPAGDAGSRIACAVLTRE